MIKRPMDLKTLKAKIRDGKIQTLKEFERDLRLIFCNAMAYNKEDTPTFKMAQEMMVESENRIDEFRKLENYGQRPRT